MGTGRVLMLISETIAVAAVATQFFVPAGMGISVHLAHTIIVLPVRWIVPLLLIIVAGILSFTALFNICWRLAHVPISAVGQ